MKTEHIYHFPQSLSLISQSLKEIMISQGISMQCSSLLCNFYLRNRIWVEPPNCQTGSRPTVQGTHLEAQLLEVISLVTLPPNNIYTSASQILVYGSMTTHDKVIMGPQRNEKIRTKQWVLIQLNVFNLEDCPFWDHVYSHFLLFLIFIFFLF